MADDDIILYVSITGPGSVQDMIDGGVQSIIQNGYEAHDFDIIQSIDGPNQSVCGTICTDQNLLDRLKADRALTMRYGEYTVELEWPL